ncbi:MAG: hypothetical protein S4CHLAM2_08350 [Chlamydiales bacterium]|nr:hypothetical protein [Chlamydiales bacterium]
MIVNTKNTSSHWEAFAPQAKTDLIIKKIAVATIALLNLAALGAVFYYLVTYCPLASTPYLVSPYVAAVIGTLASLKFPTLGISSSNYSKYTNPVALLGQGLAYLFFGPYKYAVKHCDWTPYHDPHVANALAHDIQSLSLKELAEKHGEHFSNLFKYGIIPDAFKDELHTLYQDNKPVQKGREYYKRQKLDWHGQNKKFEQEEAKLEARWNDLRARIIPYLHFPELPAHDFGSPLTQARLDMESSSWYRHPFQARA